MGISWRATDREDDQEPDGRVARRVAELIEQSKDRPFFIGAGFSKPHLPWIAPRKYFQMYPPEAIRLEKGPDDDLKDIPPIALVDVGPGDPTTDAKRAEAVAAYYACVSFVDAQVGVLLETLDRLKLWDHTIVVFWGDNGFQLGEHDLWRKMTLFEESARVPLIIVAPGMAQEGVATGHLAELVDIYPTLVELCGLPEVRGLEGTSLVPLLKDPDHAIKTAAFTMVSRDGPVPARSVRSERYRYTEWPDGSAELYDHRVDPHEYVNLAGDPASAKALAEMRRLLHPNSSLGPLRVHPGNPRYFTDGTDRAIYLTGSHTWNNLQDTGTTDPPAAMDYDRYLAILKGYNHDFTRGWAWEQAQSEPGYKGDFFISPLPFERTGPGKALDGKPRFDVSRFHQPYFDRLRSRAIAAGRQGIYLSVMLFEGWSIEDKQKGSGNPWPSHPFNAANNINGINGDPNGDGQGFETHSLEVPAVTAAQENYVKKAIDTLNDLDNVFWEISNESWARSVDWQYHMIKFIKAYEATKPKQHLVWMTGYVVPNTSLFEGPADCISPCRKDGTNYRGDPPATKGDKIIILDTDHIWGLGGDRKWVWKSFARGYHPIFMDPLFGMVAKPDFDPQAPGGGAPPGDGPHANLRREDGPCPNGPSR